MSKEPVTKSDLHEPSNSPSSLQALKPTDGSSTSLSDRQARHFAIVLDLFQAKGTMAKIKDNFTENAVYEDLFATCKNRDEVGTSFLHVSYVQQEQLSKRTLARAE
jgi:hypothetical protein